VKRETYLLSSLWKKNVKEGESCDDPVSRHLGRGGLTNPLQKEQYRKAVRTVLHTGLGVQRPEALTTNEVLLAVY